MRTTHLVSIIAALGFAAGCIRPLVFRALPRSRATAQTRVAVEPVHFGIARVNDRWRDEWMSAQSAERTESWTRGEDVLSNEFEFGLMERASRSVHFVRPTLTEQPTLIVRAVVTGMSAGDFRRDTHEPRDLSVEITVQLVTPDGRVVDECAMTGMGADPRMGGISISPLVTTGRQLGHDYAAYLVARFEGRGIAPSRADRLRATLEPRASIAPASASPAPADSSARGQPSPEPAAPMETTLTPVVVAPVRGPLLAPETRVRRVARRASPSEALREVGFAIVGAALLAGTITWLAMIPSTNDGMPHSWMAGQAALSVLPIVGPIIGATQLPRYAAGGGYALDGGMLALEAIGTVFALIGQASQRPRSVPLRPGASFVQRTILLPIGPGGAGATVAFAW